MHIRFGFVAMSLQLTDSSPSKTITATNFSKIQDQEVKKYRLEKIARQNLLNTLRILRHAVANGIYVYRITSKLIPLATHPLADFWDWQNELAGELKDLGDFIKNNKVRVSAHPDHYTIINSPKEDVFQASVKDLEYHHKIFAGMGIGNQAKLVLHTGGSYKDKSSSKDRFITNYQKLDIHLQERIVLENDDKTYTAEEVLAICETLGIPMVLDLHHHQCNPGTTNLSLLLPRIFATWQGTEQVPKIHLSSPKSSKQFRSHADNIDPEYFLEFLPTVKDINQDFDVMIEAKHKDVALFNFMEKMRSFSGFTFQDGAIVDY